MYSTHNERILKNKIYKHMTSISRNVYINKLDDIVNEQNNTYHRTIKMNPTDVNDNTCIHIDKESRSSRNNFKIQKYFC